MTNLKKDKYIPQIEFENLARLLLPKIQAYFESDKGKQEFEEWQNSLKKE